MKIPRKIELLKWSLSSVIDHDDVPEAEIQAAVDEAKRFIDAQWAAAKKRRAEKAAAKALPQ